MADTVAWAGRLVAPGHPMRPGLGRDVALMVSSIVCVALAYVGGGESTDLVTAAVLAVATATAMHARLAMGRWRAAIQIVSAGLVITLAGASPRLMGVVIITGLCASELVARSGGRSAVLRAGAWTAGIAGIVMASGLVATVTLTASEALREAVSAVVGCLLGAPILLAVGSLAEWLFGHTTRLTFAEWLSYDHPLLKELAETAPGTFQHSINVGVLAAGAADAIGADALIARVGGLYHDVGKTAAPGYFIENQTGPNPHDRLEPWESARILRAHVTDGVRMVKAHRMGERIADFVREHHGTGSMRLLRERAESAGGRGPADETYRYPGPRPRSRETAVVMLSDQLEATARAAPPSDAAGARDLVQRTVQRIQEEGELEASGLTARDLLALEPAFVRALLAMYHRRLSYPSSGAGAQSRTLGWLDRGRRSAGS